MSNSLEGSVLQEIALLEEQKQGLKQKISYLKKQLMNIETDLIGVNIKLSKADERLKKIHHSR